MAAFSIPHLQFAATTTTAAAKKITSFCARLAGLASLAAVRLRLGSSGGPAERAIELSPLWRNYFKRTE